MTHLSYEEPKRGVEPGAEQEVGWNDQQRETPKVDPKDLYIQVFRSRDEPIHSVTQDSSYTWLDAKTKFTRLQDQFGGWINTTRNNQTYRYLKETNCKFVCLIDADVGVEWWQPYKLMEHALPVVSAIVPCFSFSKGGLFANVAVLDERGIARFPTLKETKNLPKEGIVECSNAGCGCIVIRRDVLEALWEKSEKDDDAIAEEYANLVRARENKILGMVEKNGATFEEVAAGMPLVTPPDRNGFGQPFEQPVREARLAGVSGSLRRGEDICFTDRCREMGYKIYADFGVRAIHDKKIPLAWPEEALADIDVKDWLPSVFDKQVVQV